MKQHQFKVGDKFQTILGKFKISKIYTAPHDNMPLAGKRMVECRDGSVFKISTLNSWRKEGVLKV